jgi:hypothetical protein
VADNFRGTKVETDDILSDNRVEDSFNDNSNNSTNVDVDKTNVDIDKTNVDIDKTYTDNSDNSVDIDKTFIDKSDNSVDVDKTFIDKDDHSVRNQDSFNITSSFNQQTLNDDSTTVGVRQYNAGFENLNLGWLPSAAGKGLAGGGKGGGDFDLSIDNRSLQLDQSVNQAIQTGHGGDVTQAFRSDATVAFGDGSIAAEGDVDIDNSVNTFTMGDLNVGNTSIETNINDSFNDYSTEYEIEFELEIEDSFNSYNEETTIKVDDSFNDTFVVEDSFTSEIEASSANSWEWTNSGNIFSPSSGGEVEFEF